MIGDTYLSIEALQQATRAGGAAGLADYTTDDVELTQIDQRTPPAAPGIRRGREALIALAEELERRGIRMRIEDGFLTGDRGALRVVCEYPDGKQTVEHALLTVHDGKIARWSSVQAWDT